MEIEDLSHIGAVPYRIGRKGRQRSCTFRPPKTASSPNRQFVNVKLVTKKAKPKEGRGLSPSQASGKSDVKRTYASVLAPLGAGVPIATEKNSHLDLRDKDRSSNLMISSSDVGVCSSEERGFAAAKREGSAFDSVN